MKLVVDASAAASWLLASQATEAATAFQQRLDGFDLISPYVFSWEICNLLAHQSRRIEGFDLEGAFAALQAFEIRSAPPVGWREVQTMGSFAAARGLSLFDTSYLWLAMAVDGALASRDGKLLESARAAGQPVFDLR